MVYKNIVVPWHDGVIDQLKRNHCNFKSQVERLRIIALPWVEHFIRLKGCWNHITFQGAPSFRYTMGPWYYGTIVLCMIPRHYVWYHGSNKPWYHVILLPWYETQYHGAIAPRCYDMVSRCLAGMVPWHYGTNVQWYQYTMHNTVVPWSTIPWCHCSKITNANQLIAFFVWD